MDTFKNKYIKYKIKYLKLKNQLGSSSFVEPSIVLNLMWIFENSEISSNHKFLFPENLSKQVSRDKKAEQFNLFEKIMSWNDIIFNENNIINFWYDGDVVSDEQIENTTRLLPECFNFIDIRILKSKYSLDDCGIYVKVDFFKFAILLHNFEFYQNHNYYVFSDILITGLTNSQLVENRNLNYYHIILSEKKPGDIGNLPYENSFIALKKTQILYETLQDFVENSYQRLNSGMLVEGKLCDQFSSSDREIFYNLIVYLLFIYQKKIFYQEELNLDVIMGNSANETLSQIEKYFDYYTKSTDSKFINLNGKGLKTTVDVIMFPRKLVKKEIEFVTPVIELERPLNSGTY